MKISDPIFRIEMVLAKWGIFFTTEMGKSSIFSILEVGIGLETFSHQLGMQRLKFTLQFYNLRLF